MHSLPANNLRKSKDKSIKGKKDILSLNQILKKHKSQDVYFKQNESKEKKPKYLLTEKTTTHSKELFSQQKINSISPRLASPTQKTVTKSNKISPRQIEKAPSPKGKEHIKLGSLDKIMSDNDSCQEIESEEEDDNCNAIDETEVSEMNSEFMPSQKPLQKIANNIKYHINKFPTLSSNPFMSSDNQKEAAPGENMTQLYRNLLSLSKKGDRESFLETLEKILSLPKGDINYQDESGFSALHFACDEGNLKIVEILLKANCDANIKTNDKKTPLHLTASHGYFDLSKLLIENGAIINIGDNEKNTPLHLCAQGGHVELMKYFLDKLPQADTKNIYGKTPLNIAKKNEIKDLLKEYLSKKDNVYHNIKIHTASESTLNYMIKKFNGGNPNNKVMFQNTQNNININIQTNINGNNNTNIQSNGVNNRPNVSNGKKKNLVNNSNLTNTMKKNTSSLKTQNKIIISKKNSMSNFSMNSQLTNRKISLPANAQNFHKTKTLQKFITSHSGTKKEQVSPVVQTNPNNTSNNKINISVDNNEPFSRLNKTEEITKPYKTNPNDTNEDNLYNQISLNSIEEERVTPTSFVCLAMLGRGSFGEVYLVQKMNSKTLYAMKVLSKDRIMGQNLMKYAMAERNVLSLTNHPFIVKLNFAFQTNHKLFLILDYCPGGDLSKHLQFEKRFTEDRARFYLCEVLLALEDLHRRDIIFRDLKPDNVVLDEEGHAKLTDFGLSKEGVYDSQCAKSFCGSIAYLAPEMLKKQGHGKAVDWYLLGVLFYEMLVGIPPYFTDQKEEIFRNIEYGELVIPKMVSKEASELLRALLQRNPSKRLGGGPRDAEEIKEHKYFKDINWDDVYNKKISPPKMKNYSKALQLYNHPRMFQPDDQDQNSNTLLPGWSFINNEDI